MMSGQDFLCVSDLRVSRMLNEIDSSARVLILEAIRTEILKSIKFVTEVF